MGPSPVHDRRRWPDDKRTRFVRDWNAGLDHDALREKYDVQRPGHVAARLRAKGFAVMARGVGAR